MKSLIFAFTLSLFFVPVGAQQGPLPLPDEPPIPGEPIPNPPPREPIRYTLGSGQAARFGTRSFTFYTRLNLQKMASIRLVGTSGTTEVRGLWVSYADGGDYNELPRMRGDLNAGKVREVFLGGRPVFKVDMDVGSGAFWKKPGTFRIEVLSLP